MKILYIIPARGGSKGIPGKNIKMLGGKPLIQYSIETARALAEDEDICVSTDDDAIKKVVQQLGLDVPFLRPPELSTDNAATYDVLLHALKFYQDRGREYDLVVLLQPTSPFRKPGQVKAAIESWRPGLEMVVGVKITKANPYYVVFEENEKGYLVKSKQGDFASRQECPVAYEYNGAVYVIDVQSLLKRPISAFHTIKKFVMDEESSVDIDTPFDWKFAEFIIAERAV